MSLSVIKNRYAQSYVSGKNLNLMNNKTPKSEHSNSLLFLFRFGWFGYLQVLQELATVHHTALNRFRLHKQL